jgi:WD40 repeat protein
LIKIWDVSQEKNFKTFSEHDESIFTLCFDDSSEDKFLSGGKDGKVIHYDLSKNEFSELLVSKFPILSVRFLFFHVDCKYFKQECIYFNSKL